MCTAFLLAVHMPQGSPLYRAPLTQFYFPRAVMQRAFFGSVLAASAAGRVGCASGGGGSIPKGGKNSNQQQDGSRNALFLGSGRRSEVRMMGFRCATSTCRVAGRVAEEARHRSAHLIGRPKPEEQREQNEPEPTRLVTETCRMAWYVASYGPACMGQPSGHGSATARRRDGDKQSAPDSAELSLLRR